MDFVDLRQSHSAAQAALDLMVILLPQPRSAMITDVGYHAWPGIGPLERTPK